MAPRCARRETRQCRRSRLLCMIIWAMFGLARHWLATRACARRSLCGRAVDRQGALRRSTRVPHRVARSGDFRGQGVKRVASWIVNGLFVAVALAASGKRASCEFCSSWWISAMPSRCKKRTGTARTWASCSNCSPIASGWALWPSRARREADATSVTSNPIEGGRSLRCSCGLSERGDQPPRRPCAVGCAPTALVASRSVHSWRE